MAEMHDTITLKFEEEHITLPSRLVTRMLERMFDDPPARVHTSAAFGLIGAAYEGGLYAGLTLLDNQVHALVLLPGDEELNWKDAIAWAEKQGGVLPSRIDQLVLLQNLKEQFQERAYWSGEQPAAYAGYAWYQGFGYGTQSYDFIGHELRARAVRRLAI